MSQNLPVSLARKLLRLLGGEDIPAGQMKGSEVEALLQEGFIVSISHRSRRSYRMNDPAACRMYLASNYGIEGGLEEWLAVKTDKAASRAVQVRETGDSKLRGKRSFKGFLVKSPNLLMATYEGEDFPLQTRKGIALFIESYESFRIPEDMVVVGVENGENFQQIESQLELFAPLKTLFVSRYPQSKDLRSWLMEIPNRYVHFGDFDLAGLHIYQTEFYRFLPERAEFFIPPDIEGRLRSGSRKLYDEQYRKYAAMEVQDGRIEPLLRLIHQYHRGYEQEGYIP